MACLVWHLRSTLALVLEVGKLDFSIFRCFDFTWYLEVFSSSDPGGGNRVQAAVVCGKRSFARPDARTRYSFRECCTAVCTYPLPSTQCRVMLTFRELTFEQGTKPPGVVECSKVVFCWVHTWPGTKLYPGDSPDCHPTKNVCKFCTTFMPIPGTSLSFVRGMSFLPVPETSVTSGRSCHTTRVRVQRPIPDPALV